MRSFFWITGEYQRMTPTREARKSKITTSRVSFSQMFIENDYAEDSGGSLPYERELKRTFQFFWSGRGELINGGFDAPVGLG